MPKFKVTKCVDAYAHHFTIVEADTADQAVVFAKKKREPAPLGRRGLLSL